MKAQSQFWRNFLRELTHPPAQLFSTTKCVHSLSFTYLISPECIIRRYIKKKECERLVCCSVLTKPVCISVSLLLYTSSQTTSKHKTWQRPFPYRVTSVRSENRVHRSVVRVAHSERHEGRSCGWTLTRRPNPIQTIFISLLFLLKRLTERHIFDSLG